MTSYYIKEVIREEIRKIIEDMERNSFLSEEDEEAPAAEEPAPAAEETPKEEPKEEEPKEEEPPAEEEPKEEEKPEEEAPAEEEEKPADDTASSEEGGEEKKEEEPPAEEESPTGLKSVELANPVEVQNLKKKSTSIGPETQGKLLSFEYEEILDAYDQAVQKADDEESKKKIGLITKKIQNISILKHSIISKKPLDKETTMALDYYYKHTSDINELVRSDIQLATKKQIEKQLRLGKPKEKESKRTPVFTDAIQAFTVSSLDFAFRDELQRLDFNLIVYRSVETPNVLQHFLDAGTWIDKGYVTTSLNPLIVESLDKKRLPLFEMLLPAGSSVLALPCKANDYCHETEITLPRNCKFTIHGYNETRNIYKVLVEQNNA
jgi:hypothetical protein